MQAYQSVAALLGEVQGALAIDGDRVAVLDAAQLRGQIGRVVYTAVFGSGLTQETARWLIWEAAQELGIIPASIHELYTAIGRGDAPHTFTVPAINIRGLNFDTASAVFRAANQIDAGAILLEIARSEIGYTAQRPAEYVASILGAAIAEGYRGPVFIQGDHFQVSAKGYKANPEKELTAVKDLMAEAVRAGFYNIDIDTSTLVDLGFPTLEEQQRLNYEVCAELTRYARSLQPAGVTIALGGEIGEVGHKNSTVEELHAFMQGYRRALGDELPGIAKISVQTGTSHGGVVLPDGTLAQVKVDFDTLQQLSAVARDAYGLGGAVQHGASTLPAELFHRFPAIGTVEIHLATGFQNMLFDQAPAELVAASYDYIRARHADEWKAGQTEEQFLYSTRKKALGPFKQQWWDLPTADRERIGAALEQQFAFLFDQLNIKGTRPLVQAVTTLTAERRPRPHSAAEEADLEIAGDLAD